MASEGPIQPALPKLVNKKKIPNSPTNDLLEKKLDKKLTTKIMMIQALADLKSRKGVSLYAVKKYIGEKYNVDTEKLKYHIKKAIKSAVEDGTIVQTKGIGASGSFKLAPVKDKKPKTKKPRKEKEENTKNLEKKKLKEKSKKTDEKTMKTKEKSKKTEDKSAKIKEKSKKLEGKSLKSKVAKESKEDKPVKAKKKKMDTEKMPKQKKDGGEKVKKVKITADMKTPSKNKGMSRRKSIGSIIKPPKMKPRAKHGKNNFKLLIFC